MWTMRTTSEAGKKLREARKAMGLPLEKPTSLGKKLEILLEWFSEIARERQYSISQFESFPNALTASQITSYYELLELKGTISKSGFFDAMRQVDDCWFKAESQYKQSLPKPKNKPTAKA